MSLQSSPIKSVSSEEPQKQNLGTSLATMRFTHRPSDSTDIEISTHWGQRGSYLVGKLRVCGEFLNNLPTLNTMGKWWANSQCTHQIDFDGISG